MSSFNVMPDVFDDSIALLCIYGEIFLNTSILISIFSGTASMIQSTFLIL